MISGYLSRQLKQINKALTGYNDQDVTDFNENITASILDPHKRAIDTASKGAYDLSASDQSVTSVSQNRIIVSTAFSSARKGDFIRFKTGNNSYLEYPLIYVDSGNNIGVLAYDPISPVQAGDTFRVYRFLTPVSLDSSGAPQITTSAPSKAPLAKIYHDFSTTNVTDAAYTQVLASVGASNVTQAQIFMSNGNPLYLAFGGAGSEVDKLYILPGGRDTISVDIPAGTRLSVKAVDSGVTLNDGKLIINLFG